MGLFSRKSQYQKDCEAKIEELCGGFFYNENYENRLRIHNRTTKSISHDRVKSVLEHECEEGKLDLKDIESRLDELLDLDCNTLDLKIRMNQNQDTSKFRTQEDIVRFMGPGYEWEYNQKIEERKEKTREKIIKKDGYADFTKGISVSLVTSEFGVMIKDSGDSNIFQTAGIAEEKGSERKLILATLMQVADSRIIFKKALNDGGDLIIPFTSVESVERAGDDFLNINLKEYQKVQIRFTAGSGFSKKEILQYLEDEFLNLVKIDENPKASSGADDLYRLAEMYEKGLLTREEFESQKSKIISPKVCPECKTPLGTDDSFCPVCGRSV